MGVKCWERNCPKFDRGFFNLFLVVGMFSVESAYLGLIEGQPYIDGRKASLGFFSWMKAGNLRNLMQVIS